MILTFSRGSDQRLSEHFRAQEFDCQCGACPTTNIDPVLVGRLEAMRLRLGCPMILTEGFRCQAWQDELRRRGHETSKGISTHQQGRAADVWTGKHTGPELEVIAREVGFQSVGVGKTFVHVDTREEFLAWGYGPGRPGNGAA